jgi:hypothetical protein
MLAVDRNFMKLEANWHKMLTHRLRQYISKIGNALPNVSLPPSEIGNALPNVSLPPSKIGNALPNVR